MRKFRIKNKKIKAIPFIVTLLIVLLLLSSSVIAFDVAQSSPWIGGASVHSHLTVGGDTTSFETVSYVISGYGAYIPVMIQNTCATNYSDTRFVYPIPALNLINGSWLQSDAEDVLYTDSNNNILDTLATDLTSTAANWYTDLVDLSGYNTRNDKVWIANPAATRDQNWIAMDSDTNYASNDATLQITDDLTLSTDIYLPSLPVAEKEIISKEGNYELYVDAANFGVRVWNDGVATTAKLHPDGVGTYTQLTPTAAPNWSCVDDDPPNDADYVWNPSGAAPYLIDTYSLEDATGTIPEGSSITSVTVYYRIKQTGGACFAKPIIRLNATNVEGTPQACPAAYTTYNELLARPGGGSWTIDDLDNLQGGIEISDTAGNFGSCSQVYIQVDYVPPDAGHTATIAASTGSWINVEANYDTGNAGAELRIRLDGGAWTTTAVGGALHDNLDDVHIAEVTAKMDSTIIDDSGTEVLNLEYEPDEIDSTTITDTSASSNDVTISLTGNPGCISVTVGAMVITDESALPSQSSTDLHTDVAGEFNAGQTAVDQINNPGTSMGGSLGQAIDAYGNMLDQTAPDDPFFNVSMVWMLLYFISVIGAFFITFWAFKEPWLSTVFVGVVAGLFVAMTQPGAVVSWGLMFLTDLGMVAWSMLNTRKVSG